MSPIGKPVSILLIALLYIPAMESIGTIELIESSYELEVNSNERGQDNTISYVENTMVFKNTSGKDIFIKYIETDENVLEAKDWKKGVIHPGEKAFIKFRHKNIPALNGSQSIVALEICFGLPDNHEKKVKFDIKRKVKEKD